jgi:hypothetical protein
MNGLKNLSQNCPRFVLTENPMQKDYKIDKSCNSENFTYSLSSTFLFSHPFVVAHRRVWLRSFSFIHLVVYLLFEVHSRQMKISFFLNASTIASKSESFRKKIGTS